MKHTVAQTESIFYSYHIRCSALFRYYYHFLIFCLVPTDTQYLYYAKAFLFTSMTEGTVSSGPEHSTCHSESRITVENFNNILM